MIPVVKKAGTAELLFNQANKMGLSPTWVTPNGLFAVTTPSGERFINHEFSSLNSHVSTSLARNKFHTRLILERNNLPNIPFMRTKSIDEAETFLSTHGTIIVKPLRGAGSTDIKIVSNIGQLNSLDISGSILEKYVSGKELRYLVLNNSVIAVHESKYGTSVDQNRHLERVSYDNENWSPILIKMSIDISNILGLAYAAVDYLIDEDGQHFVLEVNSAPGLKWFHSPSKGPPVDVAKYFLDAMVSNN